jgi:gluconolactonase
MASVFAENVIDPEGPVRLPDGSWIITEMGRGIITHISADGKERREIARTGRPNGLARGRHGNLWVAESLHPALLRIGMEGDSTVISRGTDDLPFLWPNDLCFGPDGSIYMTDSGVLLERMQSHGNPAAVYAEEIDGRVFRVDPDSGECRILDRGLRFVNGIAIGPGGHHLYVSETLTGNIYRYKMGGDGMIAERQLFGNVMIQPPVEHGKVAGPDGMAFDAEGNLYVAVLTQGDITVLSHGGDVARRLSIDGAFPTNVAFAGPGERRIVVTEGSKNRLLMIEAPAEGLPLWT